MKILITVLLTMIAASGAFAQTDAPAKTEMTQTADSIADGPVVELTTSLGSVRIRLYNDTPLHRDNFLRLVNDGTYDGVLFHRVIDGFMIQTGDPDSKTAKPGDHLGAGDLGYTVEAEIRYPRHYHKYGALAAARTGDAMNPERRSSGSQFYIVTGRVPSERELESMELRQNQSRLQARFRELCNENREKIDSLQKSGDNEALEAFRQELIKTTEESVKTVGIDPDIRETYLQKGGTPHLDGQYTVFGEVLEGMDVVEKIQKVATDANDRPVEDVRIISAKVVKSN